MNTACCSGGGRASYETRRAYASTRLLAMRPQVALYGSMQCRKRRFAAYCRKQRTFHAMADQLAGGPRYLQAGGAVPSKCLGS